MAISALRVTPAKLKAKSSEFMSDATQVQNISQQMFDLIRQLTGAVWSGNAASAYTGQFNKLEEDTKRMYKMIKEFSDDLSEMADEYSKAESANESVGKSLKANVISF